MSIYLNIEKSKKYASEVEQFLAERQLSQEEITLPRGYSGEIDSGWNNSKIKKTPQDAMRKFMSTQVAAAKAEHKQSDFMLAKLAGEKTYQGLTCKKCGTFERHVANNTCVACYVANAKRAAEEKLNGARAKRKEETARKKAEAKKLHAAQIAAKAEERKRQREKLKIEQVAVLSEFASKAIYGDEKRLCALAGISRQTIHNVRHGDASFRDTRWPAIKQVILDFEFRPQEQVAVKESSGKKSVAKRELNKRKGQEKSRYTQLLELKKEAIANGQKNFIGPCKHHGMSKYYLLSGGKSKCSVCNIQITRNRRKAKIGAEFTETTYRNLENRKRMQLALDAGEKRFTGICKNHGESEFGMVKETRFYCITCVSNSKANYKKKMKEQEA